MDHVPAVAIVGQQARTCIGAHYQQQEVDLQSLFKDVAGEGFKGIFVNDPESRARRGMRRWQPIAR